MLEIRFHGRGGQGTVIAAKILADAVLRSGRGECMAIPEFGVERRGAPVLAYARVSDRPILARTRIYEPDAVVVLDPAFAADAGILKGLKPGGTLILNSELSPAQADARWPNLRVIAVPARRIALVRGLGSPSSPLVNTAICGAVAAALHLCDLASLEAAVRQAVPDKPDENAAAAHEAYVFVLEKSHAPR